MFLIDELESSESVLSLFRERHLLRPAQQPCPRCNDESTLLGQHADDHYTDGVRLQCSQCSRNWNCKRAGRCSLDADGTECERRVDE
jgi:hypothetical protein